MPNFLKKVKNVANINDLWNNNSKIIVGISGGPDSVCLLDILAKIREKNEIKLQLAHVNYSLREKDSKEDEKFVQNLAEKYQIGLNVLKVKKLKRRELSEENFRKIRYNFFEEMRRKSGFDYIAVAHNQDDQVETFLMHLIRGAGLQGLAGMKYKSGKIIRPLLGFPRKEIVKHLKENKLDYRLDKTNKENVFFRNKIRNKLIPYLENNFNPNIKKTIADATLNIEEDLSLISNLSKKVFKGIKELKISQILKMHPSLQKRLILREIEITKGDLKNIESSHIEEILKIAKSRKNKIQNFSFQGLKLTRKGDKLSLIKVTK